MGDVLCLIEIEIQEIQAEGIELGEIELEEIQIGYIQRTDAVPL